MIREICNGEANIINCMNEISGGTIPMLTNIGFLSIFLIPFLLKSVFKSSTKQRPHTYPILALLSKTTAFILGLCWLAQIVIIVVGLFAWVLLFGAVAIGFPLLGLVFIALSPISYIHMFLLLENDT